MKYAEVAPWHNMQKYQVPYGTNKQQVDNMKPGNKKIYTKHFIKYYM